MSGKRWRRKPRPSKAADARKAARLMTAVLQSLTPVLERLGEIGDSALETRVVDLIRSDRDKLAAGDLVREFTALRDQVSDDELRQALDRHIEAHGLYLAWLDRSSQEDE